MRLSENGAVDAYSSMCFSRGSSTPSHHSSIVALLSAMFFNGSSPAWRLEFQGLSLNSLDFLLVRVCLIDDVSHSRDFIRCNGHGTWTPCDLLSYCLLLIGNTTSCEAHQRSNVAAYRTIFARPIWEKQTNETNTSINPSFASLLLDCRTAYPARPIMVR